MGMRILAMALVGGVVAASPSQPEDLALRREMEDVKRELEVLRTRMSALERRDDASVLPLASSAAPMTTKIRAPFEIVNQGGATLVKVTAGPDGGGLITLSNRAEEVVWISALNSGGFIKTRGPATYPEVVIGTSGTMGGMAIRDADGKARVAITLSGGKPSVELSNDNHTVVAALLQGTTGGGHFNLGDAAGRVVVNAGVTAGGCGKVETIPGRPVRATALGVPGDMIVGNC